MTRAGSGQADEGRRGGSRRAFLAQVGALGATVTLGEGGRAIAAGSAQARDDRELAGEPEGEVDQRRVVIATCLREVTPGGDAERPKVADKSCYVLLVGPADQSGLSQLRLEGARRPRPL